MLTFGTLPLKMARCKRGLIRIPVPNWRYTSPMANSCIGRQIDNKRSLYFVADPAPVSLAKVTKMVSSSIETATDRLKRETETAIDLPPEGS
jgi:hypothetical protein